MNEMRGIGVVYQDEYAVEETFQLLKIPWEWYEASMGKIKRKLFIFISTKYKIVKYILKGGRH